MECCSQLSVFPPVLEAIRSVTIFGKAHKIRTVSRLDFYDDALPPCLLKMSLFIFCVQTITAYLLQDLFSFFFNRACVTVD